MIDFLIVGTGFYGSVLAERIANVLKKKVLIVDQRNHIGGNCFSDTDRETGIEYHVYGTHIFHTSMSKSGIILISLQSLIIIVTKC